MSFFLNLPISKKLLLAFSLMAIVVLALGLFAIQQLALVNNTSTVIAEEHIPRLMAVAKFDVAASDYRRRQLRMLEKHTPEEIQKYASRLQSDQTILEGELKKLQAMKLEPDDAASVQELSQLWTDYQNQHQQIATLNQQGDLAAAAQLLNGAALLLKSGNYPAVW